MCLLEHSFWYTWGIFHFFHLRKKINGTFQHVGSFANSFWILWNGTSLWIWMFLLTLFAFCKQPFSWLLEKVNMEDCQKNNCSSPGQGWLFTQSQLRTSVSPCWRICYSLLGGKMVSQLLLTISAQETVQFMREQSAVRTFPHWQSLEDLHVLPSNLQISWPQS